MISFIILLFLLVSQVVLNGYNYAEINISEDFTGSNNADISKNLTLGALVLAAVFLVFISVLYFFKFINYSRSEFLLIISIIMVAIIMLISYHYLTLQYKSGASYDSAKETLRNASVLVNENELDIALIGGIVTLGLAVIIAGLLIGKYLIAENKIVKIKEPVYVNMQTSTLKEDYKEPDYMSDVSKNFIV
jgi:lysylphosphatidylglycerol synthetase-like protein (DUF2156 family)